VLPVKQQEVQRLDPRKSAILKAVVRDYVATVEPVGSEALAQRYPLGVKPATVRNELARMTEMGYLIQPHPSAGRLPSTRGYRYYVEYLRSEVRRLRVERYLKRAPLQAGESLNELLESTLQTLAHASRHTAFATIAHDDQLRLLRCVITHCSTRRALMVAIFEHGYVENRLVELSHALNARTLERFQNVLSALLEGQTVRFLKAIPPDHTPPMESPAERETLGLFLKTMQDIAEEAADGELYYEGITYLLLQPEFQREAPRVESLMRLLEERKTLYRWLERNARPQVTVTIGEEHPLEALQPFSLVFARYYAGTRPSGVIGIVGPTRMDYDQAMPTVERMAQTLSAVLTQTLYS